MQELFDRESLLGALSIIDCLDAGWRPGDAELEDARYVESWAVLPREEGMLFRVVGLAWSLPVKIELIAAPIIALDPDGHWARLCNEWVAIGDPYEGGAVIDADAIRSASVSWLAAALRQQPLHA